MAKKLKASDKSLAMSQAVGQAIAEIEARTACDVVVVTRGQSEAYRDIAIMIGVFAACLVVMALLMSPDEFSLPVVGAAFLFTAIFVTKIVQHFNFQAVCATRRRRAAAVTTAAQSVFFTKHIADTKSRCGILLYYSRVEKEARLLCDIEALRKIGVKSVDRFAADLVTAMTNTEDQTRALVEYLRTLGVFLARVLPPSENSDSQESHEIDNQPDLET